MPEITPTRYLVTAGWDDVPHLDEKTKRELWASSPPHEREARAKGIPTLGSGLIFPVEEDAIKVQPIPIPLHWKRINGIDFGWDHPTGATSLAYDADADVIYVVADYGESETVPAMHCATLRPWGDWIPWAWPHDGLQHEKGTGEQLARQYEGHGLKMLPERATWPDGGNSVEAGVQDMLERMQTGRWKVFSTCTKWLAERRLYHRKDGKIIKLRDDVISSSRYAYMMLRYAIPSPRARESWMSRIKRRGSAQAA